MKQRLQAQPVFACATRVRAPQACSQCLGRAIWLELSHRSCEVGIQKFAALDAEARKKKSLYEMCREPHPKPMLCLGVNTPTFPARGASAQAGTQRRHAAEVLSTEALRSYFDPDTAGTFPFKCGAALLADVYLRSQGARIAPRMYLCCFAAGVQRR